ncbi:hypothetical protein [Duganella sp. Root1480D1]|uniref:hypothetical protein n=1 Tax=Duganella sp. Root1480D1 TaxID=1736471 RepID=UPI0012E3C237|nr:hypothetical protein [Duganella sp. Root1480D1]
MIRKLIAASAVWLVSLNATASCPTSHFEPTIEIGSYFPGSGDILQAQWSATPDAEMALVFVEMGRREPGYDSGYMISLMREGQHGDGTLFLTRLKDGKPVSLQVQVSANEVRDLVQKLSPILLNTHYSPAGCPIHYTDGFAVQMAVDEPGRGLIGGEVYSPMEEWEAGKAVAIGRMLKARVLTEEGK